MTNKSITKIEQFVIDKVKELRVENGFSQEGIAAILDSSRGFIGQIESSKNPAKYNLNHLNTLAIEFKCSPKDFLPEKPLLETRKTKRK